MSRFREMLRNLVGWGGPRPAGPPLSANGASSFHLVWDADQLPSSHLVEVAATLQVVTPPEVESLYFWALQVDLADSDGVWGGAHTGLQWNPRFAGGRAVNWGGYAAPVHGGHILSGSQSALPAFVGDPNTVDFDWRAGRSYRFRVFPSPFHSAAWRAEIIDLASGTVTQIRDLFAPAGRGQALPHLARPLVWSEIFADCDAPSVTVRWSDFQALTADGSIWEPGAVRVNYQSAEEGGCANTTAVLDHRGVLQITNTARSTAQGTVLSLPDAI